MEERDRDVPGWIFWLISWVAGVVALFVVFGTGSFGFEVVARAHAGPLATLFVPVSARAAALVTTGLTLALAPLVAAYLWRRTRTAALVSGVGPLVWLVVGVLSQVPAWDA